MIRRTLLIFFKVSFQNFWQSLRLHKFSVKFFRQGFDKKMKNPNGRGGGLRIMEFRGQGRITHFGNSEGKGWGGGGLVKCGIKIKLPAQRSCLMFI